MERKFASNRFHRKYRYPIEHAINYQEAENDYMKRGEMSRRKVEKYRIYSLWANTKCLSTAVVFTSGSWV
jgi:hypothetical protein